MAAVLRTEGRYPAVQVISEAEFKRFVELCQNAPAPTPKLRMLLKTPSEAK
jgi:uncharacterized protein (DUF1778 family)